MISTSRQTAAQSRNTPRTLRSSCDSRGQPDTRTADRYLPDRSCARRGCLHSQHTGNSVGPDPRPLAAILLLGGEIHTAAPSARNLLLPTKNHPPAAPQGPAPAPPKPRGPAMTPHILLCVPSSHPSEKSFQSCCDTRSPSLLS